MIYLFMTVVVAILVSSRSPRVTPVLVKVKPAQRIFKKQGSSN